MAYEASEDVIKIAETLRMLQEQFQCVVCLGTLQDATSTRCGHTFCQQCINRIAKSKNALCPLCNARLNRRGIVQSEKIRSLVRAMQVMLSSAQVDITEMGYEDDYLIRKEQKLSTKESPPSRGNPAVIMSTEQNQNVSKGSSKVESWLLGVAPISSTPEPNQLITHPLEHTSPTDFSDSEMVSVSQVNPDTLKNTKISDAKPLSAYIEDDGEPEKSTSKLKSVKIKNTTKTLATKKVGLSRSKTRQESVKSLFGRMNQTSISVSSTANTDISEMKVPDPVLVVINGEKENTTNPLPSRSPGWSRVQKMKKDFDQPSKVLRTVNYQGDNSPVIIEDIGSGDEQPCMNLSLDSPVLKKKAKVNEIVNNLETELEVLEKSIQFKNSTPVKTSLFNKKTENSVTLSKLTGVHAVKPIVQFLKLGSIATKKSPSVPIYLRGSLEHLYYPGATHEPYRQLKDAETQTPCETSVGHTTKASVAQKQSSESSDKVSATSHNERRQEEHTDSDIEMMDAETVLFSQPVGSNTCLDLDARRALSPAKTRECPRKGKSGEILSESDPEIMDAETVLFTQPVAPTKHLSIKAGQLESVVAETDLMGTELVEIPSTMPECTEDSQKSISVVCSQDGQRTPQNNFNDIGENACLINRRGNKTGNSESDNVLSVNSIVDLDSPSSSVVGGNKTKKGRAVCSSSDSSDSEIGVPKKRTNKGKKRKQQVLSDNEDSCPIDLNISAVDTNKIMANIMANIEDTDITQSPEPEWFTDAKKKIEERTVAVESRGNDDDIDMIYDVFDTSRNEIDSDGDSELINPTPQKLTQQTSYFSKSITHSDDIVPSSQPPIEIQKLPPLLQSSVNETIPEGTQSLNHEQAISANKSPSPLSESKNEQEDASVQHFVTASSSILGAASEPVETSRATDVPPSPALPTVPVIPPKPVFVCSSIAPHLSSLVEKLASLVGGEFSPTFTANTTHLIVRVDDGKRADKTLKYLSAVAAGKWVVSFAWVEKSLEAKTLLSEEPFEALDTTGEPGPRRSREARINGKRLFDGFEFCCVGEFQNLSIGQMEALLKESGASIVAKPTDFSFRDRIIPVTLAQWEDMKEEQLATWLDQYSSPMIQYDWVLDCIGKFCVTSFQPSLICDYSDDLLCSMGIPAYLYEAVDTEQEQEQE